MVRWSNSVRGVSNNRKGGLVDRDRYVEPGNIYEQMKTAQWAAEHDDVVSGVVESTEALAFNRVSVDCEDEDETDVWNQIAEDIDLGARLRELWQEDFSLSNGYCAVWWGVKDYKVRGKSKETGITRKKRYDGLIVPLGLSVLDPLKIVPVGNLMFGRDMLAYSADRGEYDIIKAVLEGRAEDPMISKLMLRPYVPSDVEKTLLAEDGVETGRLFLMNPENVWRHTSTRAHYKRFAPVRMKSIFELLDLKRQLRAMDRAHLLGRRTSSCSSRRAPRTARPRPVRSPTCRTRSAPSRTATSPGAAPLQPVDRALILQVSPRCRIVPADTISGIGAGA